ncbi:hypothetical protein D3C72_674560 [compost metagenome]
MHRHVFTAPNDAAVFDAPVGGEGHATGLGTHRPGVTHADPFFRPDHADFTGIHSAETGDIHRQLRSRGDVIGAFFNAFMRGIDVVASGGNFQILGPQPGIHFDRAGDDIGVIRAGGVHPGTVHHHFTAFHVVPGEIAVGHLRLAGGERRAVGVDKPAPATGNTRRVGDHHLRFFPRDFNHAVQFARVAGADFVQNHFRFALGEPRVARHHAAQLRLGIFMRVIEDCAFLADVKLGVVIARHPGFGRGLDIHLRRAVGAGDHRRLLVFWRPRVGHNIGLRRLYRTHCQPETQTHGTDFTDKLAVGMADPGGTRGPGATRTGNICHHHQHAARFVEDDTIQILIHGSFL